MSVRIEKNEHVWTVIIDRPEVRNAIDRDTAEGLADAFRAFDADETARAAVLWGSGGTFCAGADLRALAAGNPNRIDAEGDGPLGPTRMLLSKPVIAAISGYAVAGGLELAIWCDLRVAEEDATLGVFCRRFGVPLIDGGTIRLPRLIGHSHALDMILTGRPVPADEARMMGLVNRVVPRGEARAHAEQLAREISAFPQEVMRADRLSSYAQWSLPFDAAVQNELKGGVEAVMKGGFGGASEFVSGKGRHGKF